MGTCAQASCCPEKTGPPGARPTGGSACWEQGLWDRACPAPDTGPRGMWVVPERQAAPQQPGCGPGPCLSCPHILSGWACPQALFCSPSSVLSL